MVAGNLVVDHPCAATSACITATSTTVAIARTCPQDRQDHQDRPGRSLMGPGRKRFFPARMAVAARIGRAASVGVAAGENLRTIGGRSTPASGPVLAWVEDFDASGHGPRSE